MKAVPKSKLLLVELICDLFLFVLCAVVCAALLVHAGTMSRESTELTEAVYLAQSAAERWKAGMGPESSTDYQVAFVDTGDPKAVDVVVSKGGRLVYALKGVRSP